MTDLAHASYNTNIMWASKRTANGFTIIELIIVVIVIGILAGVIAISYRSSQERARFAAYKSDIVRINEAIQVYHAENGRYPLGSTLAASGCTVYSPTNVYYISGLYPGYLNPWPIPPSYNSGTNYYAYCWSGNGAEYKIIRLVSSTQTLPSIESTSTDITIDPFRPTRGWGFWSPGAANI